MVASAPIAQHSLGQPVQTTSPEEQEKQRSVRCKQVGFMQGFSVAFGRVSRATFSANPELKTHITDLVNRAYMNLHNAPLSQAENGWANAVVAAALQLCTDSRVQQLSTRELIHLFENVIRISEEHLREAKRHAAMASNVFYLKETALDAALHAQDDLSAFNHAASKVIGLSHGGRLAQRRTSDSDA